MFTRVCFRFGMAARPDNEDGLFSGTESDNEPFEGFDARDTRRYSQIASKLSNVVHI